MKQTSHAQQRSSRKVARPCALAGLSLACLLAGIQPADAQTVQLPTFSFFSVQTTVVAPDSGRAYLGGTKRARYSSRSRGVPLVGSVPGLGRLVRDRAISSSAGESSASVTATIIDHAALDRALLAEARGKRPAELLGARARVGLELTASIPASSDRSGESLAAIRARQQREEAAQVARLRAIWEEAKTAEAAGLLGAARCRYNHVARQSTGRVRAAALARIAALDEKPTTSPLVSATNRAEPR